MGRWTSGGDRRAAATVAVRLATLHADPAAGPRGPGKSLAHPVFVFLPSAPTSQRNRETKTPPLLFKHLKGVECCTALCQSEVLESPGNILDMVQVDRCGAAALCPGVQLVVRLIHLQSCSLMRRVPFPLLQCDVGEKQ